MADPTPYTVSYSFAGWQASEPERPLPAAQVDNEFANLATAIGELVTAVTSIRRSDGMLQNGLIGIDQIDPQLAELFDNPREITTFDLSPTAFASESDAEAAAANDKLMTPLRTSQTIGALRPFASQIQAETGTNLTVVMSPGRTANYVNQRIRTGTAELTFPEISSEASETQTITVSGAAVGDAVMIGPPAAGPTSGLTVDAWVSAADTVTLRLTNITSAALTPPASQTWRATVVKG